jgi:hypothetical protein
LQDLPTGNLLGTVARCPIFFVAPIFFLFLVIKQKFFRLHTIPKYFLYYFIISLLSSILMLIITVIFFTEGNMYQYGEFFPIKLLKIGAENTHDIVKDVGVEGVDIISSFFSLSFFFFPGTNNLDNLVQTIFQNLKEDGFFIGTTIDGKRTTELLNPLPDKKFNFGEGFIQINTDQTVTFEIKGTIVETQKESLVDFELLTKKLQDVGIILEDSKFFKDNKDLSSYENELNSLYRTFIFHKNNMTEKINKLCNKNTFFNLLSRSTDEKCFELFRKLYKEKQIPFLNKKVEIKELDPKYLYNKMSEFYSVKSLINPIHSNNLIKYYSLFGNRIHKYLVHDYIPKDAVTIFKYKDKKDYPSIREQIIETLLKLKEKNISYNNLSNLLILKDNTGYVKVIFDNFGYLDEGNFEKDENDLKHILEYLNK